MLACNAWTSPNRIPFLSICGAYINEDWELCESMLDFTEMKGVHSGENMVKCIYTTLKELRIIEKVSI